MVPCLKKLRSFNKKKVLKHCHWYAKLFFQKKMSKYQNLSLLDRDEIRVIILKSSI